jgi:hypothetical protein
LRFCGSDLLVLTPMRATPSHAWPCGTDDAIFTQRDLSEANLAMVGLDVEAFMAFLTGAHASTTIPAAHFVDDNIFEPCRVRA